MKTVAIRYFLSFFLICVVMGDVFGMEKAFQLISSQADTAKMSDSELSRSSPTMTSNHVESVWRQFQQYYYGPDNKNVYEYAKPKGPSKSQNLVILVHGGNFLEGSATEDILAPLAEFFLQQGSAVASLEYRSLKDADWPAPIEDIREGVESVVQRFGSKGTKTIYVGYSAGAVAGALLLYSPQFARPPLQVNKFIGISGLYSRQATTKEPVQLIQDESRNHLNILEVIADITNPIARTPALIIEGSEDTFADNYPNTPASHAAYLAQLLRQNRIQAGVYWSNQPGFNDHEGPLKLIARRDPVLIETIEQFLGPSNRL